MGSAETSILTPDQRLRVFISSTLGELAHERDAVEAAVRTLRLTRTRTGIHTWPIMGMIFGDRLAALESAGPEVEAARFAGRQMSADDAMAVLLSR